MASHSPRERAFDKVVIHLLLIWRNAGQPRSSRFRVSKLSGNRVRTKFDLLCPFTQTRSGGIGAFMTSKNCRCISHKMRDNTRGAWCWGRPGDDKVKPCKSALWNLYVANCCGERFTKQGLAKCSLDSKCNNRQCTAKHFKVGSSWPWANTSTSTTTSKNWKYWSIGWIHDSLSSFFSHVYYSLEVSYYSMLSYIYISFYIFSFCYLFSCYITSHPLLFLFSSTLVLPTSLSFLILSQSHPILVSLILWLWRNHFCCDGVCQTPRGFLICYSDIQFSLLTLFPRP